LNADAGDDLIVAGKGSDTITTGSGADRIMLLPEPQSATVIEDFSLGIDLLDLTAIPDIDALTADMIGLDGADVMLRLLGDQTVLLRGVSPAQLLDAQDSLLFAISDTGGVSAKGSRADVHLSPKISISAVIPDTHVEDEGFAIPGISLAGDEDGWVAVEITATRLSGHDFAGAQSTSSGKGSASGKGNGSSHDFAGAQSTSSGKGSASGKGKGQNKGNKNPPEPSSDQVDDLLAPAFSLDIPDPVDLFSAAAVAGVEVGTADNRIVIEGRLDFVNDALETLMIAPARDMDKTLSLEVSVSTLAGSGATKTHYIEAQGVEDAPKIVSKEAAALALFDTPANQMIDTGRAVIFTEADLTALWTDPEGDAVSLNGFEVVDGTLTEISEGLWMLGARAAEGASLRMSVEAGGLSSTSTFDLLAGATGESSVANGINTASDALTVIPISSDFNVTNVPILLEDGVLKIGEMSAISIPEADLDGLALDFADGLFLGIGHFDAIGGPDGTDGNDWILGGRRDSFLFGEDGDDLITVSAESGVSHVFAGAGDDVVAISRRDPTEIATGPGNDTIVFQPDPSRGPTGLFTITVQDFTVGEDHIDLSDLGFEWEDLHFRELRFRGGSETAIEGSKEGIRLAVALQDVDPESLTADSFIFLSDEAEWQQFG